VEQVHNLCEEKVIDEEAVRDTFISSIEENKAKSLEAANRLGETTPNIEKDEDGSEVGEQFCISFKFIYFCIYSPLLIRSSPRSDCNIGSHFTTCLL
jgi:hypothetical protein